MTIKGVEMIKTTLNGEYEIVLPKHRADRPEWHKPEGWEKKRLRTLKAQIEFQKERLGIQPVVFYVGSEEGEMPALCQMWGAKVFMFEPNPRVIPNTKAIYDANKLEAPAGFFVGFAANETDNKGEPVHLDEFPPCADGEIIGDHGFKELAYEHNIPRIKIDDLVKETGLVPTIITTDCEGSDWEVLKGAEQTIRDHSPVLIISWHPEFMFDMFKQYTGDARKWVRDFNYRELFLDYQHEVHMCYVPFKHYAEN